MCSTIMEDECLSLTWNNHGSTYRHTLSVLREENTLTDVTLACDGQKFTAHKLVLVTCSDYFRKILGNVPCQHPIVYMRGVAAKDMQALIDFMYTGQTDIPQKEVPTLLSTAEALQIKGLGVFTSGDGFEGEKAAVSQKDRNTSSNRKRSAESSPQVFDSDGARNGSLKSTSSKQDNLLENLYSHHYALKSSPKRRKADERADIRTSEGSVPSLPPPVSEKLSQRNFHPPSSAKDSSQSDSCSSHDPYHNRQPCIPNISLSTSSTSSYTSSTVNSVSSENTMKMNANPNKGLEIPSSQQPLQDPKPEAKTASPRALNYSLAGMGGSREEFTAGSYDHMLNESDPGLADTPEKLMKSEIKEEALDFSNTALSENLHTDPVSAALSATSIEEETRIYLDAFARSANLTRPIHVEEAQQEPTSGDGRPFVCPICQKCFAKAAILKRHHLAHFRPYVCHLCTRSFTRREVLAEHLLEHNGADLRMPCPVCNMTIKRKRNLQAHIKVKHPDYYRQKIASRESLC